ncbi:uncharacterized protein LOC129569473 [Sitodiplosis mosellana]|uniref:uncharacterized protein LOC129569473 n=1 Tax=Sitodiplosis mosellana TaxID=263140 RepID=UPI002444C127|nr:uncharacterized protein LOC129569473 [Sitodiplosis mosellana]
MQPFIWDDRNYRLIEEGEKYDEKIFTVVRKLFVRYNVYTADATEEIRDAFGDYGDVESFEILKQKASPQIGMNVNEEGVAHEAYVTFKQSLDAYKTVMSRFVRGNLIYLVPADTWHQPDYKDSVQLMGYIRSTHKCDNAIADMACSFEELSLRGDEMLCDQTVIEFELELKPGVTLAEMRRNLLCLMPKANHLKLTLCDGFGSDADADCVDECNFHRRVLEVIGMIAATGPKLEEMTIGGFGQITENMLKCLAPALQPLNALAIYTDGFNVLFLLHTFCPNLVTFEMLSEIPQDDGDDTPIQSWPTLTELVLCSDKFNAEIDTQNSMRLCRFLSLNPQLRTLDVNFVLAVDNSLLKVIADSIRELKTLAFNQAAFGDVDVYNHLGRLEHLESIRITTNIFKTCHFGSLFACVERFSKMKRLKMATLQQNFTPNNTDPIFLDYFPITHHYNCVCHDRYSQVLTFADRTDSISVPKDKRTLAILIGVARELKIADDTLDARISTLFAETKMFYPNVHKTTIIQEDDRSVFLYVASML